MAVQGRIDVSSSSGQSTASLSLLASRSSNTRISTSILVLRLCSDDARFFNHADEPNTASVESAAGGYVDVATRDIAKGDELTCDSGRSIVTGNTRCRRYDSWDRRPRRHLI